ncbi:MAG: hypothetical protein R3F53_18255 [Gammaproteobacteria bacterium]
MKWTARLHDKNFIDMPSQQVSKVPKPPLDTLDTSVNEENDNNFTITRAEIEQHYPDILILPDGHQVKLADVLDCAMDTSGNDSGDWPDLMNAECLQAFAMSLLMTGDIREVRV